jgi:hypothetical protein
MHAFYGSGITLTKNQTHTTVTSVVQQQYTMVGH